VRCGGSRGARQATEPEGLRSHSLVPRSLPRAALPFSAATVQADGGEVQTVEVLRTMDALRPLQQAFRKLQCGY
jgi:hypothetical protein